MRLEELLYVMSVMFLTITAVATLVYDMMNSTSVDSGGYAYFTFTFPIMIYSYLQVSRPNFAMRWYVLGTYLLYFIPYATTAALFMVYYFKWRDCMGNPNAIKVESDIWYWTDFTEYMCGEQSVQS